MWVGAGSALARSNCGRQVDWLLAGSLASSVCGAPAPAAAESPRPLAVLDPALLQAAWFPVTAVRAVRPVPARAGGAAWSGFRVPAGASSAAASRCWRSVSSVFCARKSVVPGGVAVLVNLLRNQLDAGNAADEGGQTLRPVRGAVESDTPGSPANTPAGSADRSCFCWVAKLLAGLPLPVGQRLALLLDSGARRSCCWRCNASRRFLSVGLPRLPVPRPSRNSSIAARWPAASARASSTLGKRVLRKLLREEFPHLLDPNLFVLDQLRQAVHVAVQIDKDVIAGAGGEDVTHVLQRPDEGARRCRAFATPPSPARCAVPCVRPPLSCWFFS